PPLVSDCFLIDALTCELYPLSLHDALPISGVNRIRCDDRFHPAARSCSSRSGTARGGQHTARTGRGRGPTEQGDIRRDNNDVVRSEEHTSELQSLTNLVCRLLLETNKSNIT